MRKVIYEVNGIRTESYSEMVNLEKIYNKGAKVILEEIKEAPTEMSPIRKAMIEQFGYCSPKFKNKVVL